MSESEAIAALSDMEAIWDELFPAEQARIVQLLVDAVTIAPEGMDLRLRVDGMSSLIAELKSLERTAA